MRDRGGSEDRSVWCGVSDVVWTWMWTDSVVMVGEVGSACSSVMCSLGDDCVDVEWSVLASVDLVGVSVCVADRLDCVCNCWLTADGAVWSVCCDVVSVG